MKKLVLKKAVLDSAGNASRPLESYKIRYADELNAEQLQAVSEEVGPDRTLLVCCGAFRGDALLERGQRPFSVSPFNLVGFAVRPRNVKCRHQRDLIV